MVWRVWCSDGRQPWEFASSAWLSVLPQSTADSTGLHPVPPQALCQGRSSKGPPLTLPSCHCPRSPDLLPCLPEGT